MNLLRLKSKRGGFGVSEIMRWALYLAIGAVAVVVFRAIIVNLSR